MTLQIVALGNGGFSLEPDNLLLDHYALSTTGRTQPRVCFLVPASANSTLKIHSFQQAMRRFTRHASVAQLSIPNETDIGRHLLAQDLIYVSGGHLPHMLSMWRQFGIDGILREAYEQGTVLAGVDAGSLCWFEWALSDANPKQLTPIKGLGYLSGGHAVQYDSEPARRSNFRRAVTVNPNGGYAVDNGVALHYIDGRLHRAVCSRPDARAWRVDPISLDGIPTGNTREQEIVPEYLGRSFAATPYAYKFPLIRRAAPCDAPHIHSAHYRSIREIAARDYSEEQITAWTGAPYDEQRSADLTWQIRNERVWVVELNGQIEGFAHLRMPQDMYPSAYLHALYLTPIVAGQGLARRLMHLIEDEVRRLGLRRIDLHSSITAQGFYLAMGFTSAGCSVNHVVRGVGLPCHPMSKRL